MKKIVFVNVCILFIAVFASCSYAGTKEEYLEYLKQSTNEEVQEVFYDDFDGNGSYEMFAVVGDKNEAEGTIYGEVWYVNDLYTQLDAPKRGFVLGSARVVDLGDVKHFYIDEYYAVERITLVFNTNSATSMPMLDNGQLTYESNSNIICNSSDTDIGYYDGIWSGRSYKDYWYYWDSNDMMYKEYGGTNITKEQLMLFDGGKEILDEVEGEITDIFYRGNNKININVKKETADGYTMGNYLLGYDENSVWIIPEERRIYDNSGNYETAEYYGPRDGYYKKALDESIATYTEFKTPDVKDAITVILNGEEISFDVQPYIENGVTMVPMRSIFEALGAEIYYDAETKTIRASKGNTVVELVTGSKYALINGESKVLSAPVVNKNGSTMVPLRFVSEALGAEVSWDAETKTITINSENNIDDESEESPETISMENPFADYSNEIYNIYDNRNNTVDAIAWGWSNITYGIEHIFDLEEEPQDIEYGKLVLSEILNKVPEINYTPADADDIVSSIKLTDDGLSIVNNYFGIASEESKLLGEAVDKMDTVIDWAVFTIDEIEYILNDYGNNIQYFILLKENSDDQYVNELIDELMVDYTDKWYKTVIDVNEKIVDGSVESVMDAGLGAYTAGLYPLAKYANEVYVSLSGLKDKTDAIANFYLACRMIYPVDKAYESSVNRYNNGECDINEVQAMFELNKAIKIYAYECIEGFAKGDDIKIAGERVAEINRINMKNGKIEISEGAGNGAMGGR